jgi:hypothetical protein
MDLLRSRNGQIGAAAVLLIAVVGGGWLMLRGSPTPPPVAVATATPTPEPTPSPTPEPSPTPKPEPKPKPEIKRCPLTGKRLEHPRMLKDPALAVQIENHPLARPVRNLGLADMVVEATVEGDVTRYTGIYLCERTAGRLIGPERSGRYYSIDLWQDMHVLPYMFGAGGEGVRRYRKANMPFVNGITGQWPYYVRTRDRPAPHNLYTDLQKVRTDFGHNQKLDRLAKRVGKLRPPFRFDAHARRPTGRPISHVQFWTNNYWNFGWDWDRRFGLWRRNEDGRTHVDAGTHRVLSARSVVVQYVREDIVYGPHDPGGYPRRYHHLVGRGRGTLYVGGRAIALRWSRPTKFSVTHWTYVHGGKAVVLPPGVVWREILPRYTRVIHRHA